MSEGRFEQSMSAQESVKKELNENGAESKEVIEREAYMDHVEEILNGFNDVSEGTSVERGWGSLYDCKVEDGKGNTLTWVEEFSMLKTPMELRDSKGRLMAQSLDGKEWAVYQYIEAGSDFVINGKGPKDFEMKDVLLERDPEKEKWELYRGTNWEDNHEWTLAGAAMAEANSIYDAKERQLQTAVDPNRGIFVTFKDPESTQAKFYRAAVEANLKNIEREHRLMEK